MWRLTEHDAQGLLRQDVSLSLTASPTPWVPHQSASFGTQLYPQRLSSLAAVACHGFERRYGDDGQLLSERACAHGQWHGVSRSFYPDAPHQLQQLAEYEHGLAHGPRRLYGADGELVALERWERGLRHGQWQRWRAGALIEQLEYERGALAGTSHHYYDDGSPRAVRNWREGQLHGPAQDWHPNGHLWASRRYVYGRPDGDFALYHPNRQKLVQGQWSRGLPVGRWRGWFEGGQARFDGAFYDQNEVKRCQMRYKQHHELCVGHRLNSPACHLRYNPVTKRFDLPWRSSSYVPCTGIVGKPSPNWRWWDERGRSRALPAPPIDSPAQRRMAKYQRRCDRHLELPTQALDVKHQAIAARLNHADASWHKGYLSPSYARCLELNAPLF